MSNLSEATQPTTNRSTETYSEVDKTTDLVKSEQESELHSSSVQTDKQELNSQSEYKEHTQLKEEGEPLFVEDRTKNFQLHQPIRYESYNSERRNIPKVDERQNASNQRQNSCWNCGSSDHALQSCTEPRNQRIIAQNRQIFLLQKQQQQQQSSRNFKNRPGGQRNNRYFFEGDMSPFSNFTPGVISEELLKALDVPKNGIPLHVYYMRETGYPNGWLEEAREKYSGISIFTEPNKCLPFPGEANKEDEDDVFNCNINKRKLHEYPGFNAPCPPDFIDDYKTLGCPIYNPEQSLELMYKKLKVNTFGKNLKEFPGCNSNSENTAFASKSNGTLIGEKCIDSKIVDEDKPPSSPEDGEITDDDNDDICLNENVVESPCNDEETNEIVLEKIDNELNHSDTFISCLNDTMESVNGTQLSLSNSMKDENELNLTASSSKRKFGDIKSEVLGTTVLKRFSTYENRPTHEHFAKGMVDMVDHENLPNAVGTFKKIKEILKDVYYGKNKEEEI